MKNYRYLLGTLIFLLTISCTKNTNSPNELKVVLSGSEIASLDPSLMQTDSGSYRIGYQIYDRLTVEDENNQFKPSSIVDKVITLSPFKMRFILHKGIVFHDLTDLTAEDVAFSLNRAMNSPFVKQFFILIKSVTAIDHLTVEIQTHKPNTHLFEFLAQVPASIVSQKVVQSNPKEWSLHPIGSGVFKFVQWKMNQYVNLERFPLNDSIKKLGGDSHYIQKLKFLWIPNEYTRYLALKTQKVDIVYDLNPFVAQDILKDEQSHLKLHMTPSLTLNFIGFNHKSSLFKNWSCRKELFHLLDRETITQTAYGNLAHAATNFVSPLVDQTEVLSSYHRGYHISGQCAQILKKPILLVTTADSKRTMMATNLQNQLAKYGISVKIQSSDWGNLMQAIQKEHFDLFMYPETGRFLFPLYFYQALLFNDQTHHNLMYFNHKSVNLLLNQLSESTNKKDNLMTIKEINLLLSKELPLIPLNFPNQLVGYNIRVKNLTSLYSSIIDFSTIKLE